jgi:hypothetical protein
MNKNFNFVYDEFKIMLVWNKNIYLLETNVVRYLATCIEQ